MRKLNVFASILLLMGTAQAQLLKPAASASPPKLTEEQIYVTKKSGTEPPFHNLYWNNHEDGIYVDLYTGKALFSSLDKYDSGTGWPSFTRPIDDQEVTTKKDHELAEERNEVRSASSDSHLGHVFDDGPKNAGGKRYCMNSAALKFIPVDAMKGTQYSPYLFAFAKKKKWEIATLAGGCFWGMEHILQSQPGVIETQTGYAGGTKPNPTYEEVSTGTTGYAESLQILYDPKVTTYEKLLLQFFKMHDPTTKDQQENDKGSQYRSAIFYENDAQKKTAEAIKKRVSDSNAWKKPIVTEITPLGKFWRAEDHHQKYLVKHPQGYSCHYIRNLKF